MIRVVFLVNLSRKLIDHSEPGEIDDDLGCELSSPAPALGESGLHPPPAPARSIPKASILVGKAGVRRTGERRSIAGADA